MLRTRSPRLLLSLLATAPLALAGIGCEQLLGASSDPGASGSSSSSGGGDPFAGGGGAGDTEGGTPGGSGAALPGLGSLIGECAPVAWLACGQSWTGDSRGPVATQNIDFWPVSVGNYDGPEVAFAFRPDASGEASVRLLDADPTAMNQDLFVLSGSDRCERDAASARGFNSLDLEVEAGEVHFLVVDGFDGDAGTFTIELDCDLGGPSGNIEPEGSGCSPDLDVGATVETVLGSHGAAGLERSFPPGQTVLQQNYGQNQVCFDGALDAAVRSWLEDGDDYESPLALVEEIDSGPCLQPDPTERVRCFMNQPGSRVELIVPGGPHQAEHGENLGENWLFFLDLPALSDHLYWAVVPRDGGDVGNYGFH